MAKKAASAGQEMTLEERRNRSNEALKHNPDISAKALAEAIGYTIPSDGEMSWNSYVSQRRKAVKAELGISGQPVTRGPKPGSTQPKEVSPLAKMSIGRDLVEAVGGDFDTAAAVLGALHQVVSPSAFQGLDAWRKFSETAGDHAKAVKLFDAIPR